MHKYERQHPTKQQQYGHLPAISQTIQIRQRHIGHCWWSKDEFRSDIILWTPTHGHSSVGWPVNTYIYQLRVDTGCSLEDLPGVIDHRMDGEKKSRDSMSSVWQWYLYRQNLFSFSKGLSLINNNFVFIVNDLAFRYKNFRNT